MCEMGNVLSWKITFVGDEQEGTGFTVVWDRMPCWLLQWLQATRKDLQERDTTERGS